MRSCLVLNFVGGRPSCWVRFLTVGKYKGFVYWEWEGHDFRKVCGKGEFGEGQIDRIETIAIASNNCFKNTKPTFQHPSYPIFSLPNLFFTCSQIMQMSLCWRGAVPVSWHAILVVFPKEPQ